MANEIPVVNLVSTRGFASPPVDRAQPVMPPAPPFRGDGGAVQPLTSDPMSLPAALTNIQPMRIEQTDSQTGASTGLAAPRSMDSPAVRPIR
jgi:hypothetical protein